MSNNKSFVVKNGLQAGRYLGSNGTETAGSVEYQVSTAVYQQRFSVGQNTRSASFNDDGTKMFVTSSTAETVREYTLSTAYDVSTASYVDEFSLQGTNIGQTYFKAGGIQFYNIDGGGDAVYQYSMSTAWDISTATYDSKSFSTSSQDTLGYGLYFKSDGTKFYTAGADNDSVYEYSLSTAWDLSTASYITAFSTAAQVLNPRAVGFKPDGTEMYIGASPSIYIYSLSTAWSISTASYISTLTTNGANPASIDFGNSGAVMIVSDGTANAVDQYSTVGYTQTLDLSTGTTFSFTPSGATTVSFTNPPATGTAIGFSVEIIGDGSAITWPSSVKWHLATAPTATATKELYTFVTTDGGTTYYGKKAAEGIA